MDKKLWLWQNGDHFWAFEHLYPKVSPGGDPCTLGEPVGYALLKKSHSSDPREPAGIPAPEGAELPPLPTAYYELGTHNSLSRPGHSLGKDGYTADQMRDYARAALAQSPALDYARRLAVSMWEKHYKADAPNWVPLRDLLGLMTQIDNMLTGPVPPAYATEINRLRNVIQAACSGGLDHMIERWKVLFPDAPVPTVAASVASAPVEWRKGVQEAYGWLWHINNEPLAPVPLLSKGKAAYQARKALRDLLTSAERGEAINAVTATIDNMAGIQAPATVVPAEGGQP